MTTAAVPETCATCQGNGEIVIDWELYLHGRDGTDADDDAVADCPDCDGTGTNPPTYTEEAPQL